MSGRRLTFLQACAELGVGVEDVHTVTDVSSSASEGENDEIFENEEIAAVMNEGFICIINGA